MNDYSRGSSNSSISIKSRKREAIIYQAIGSDVQDDELTKQDSFVAEFHKGEMSLEKIKDLTFICSINKGDRNKPHFLCSQVRGPFDFYEMVNFIGETYKDFMVHGKAVSLTKTFEEQPLVLDAGTIDYIEAHYKDIIMDGILGESGPFAGIQKTIEPGFTSSAPEESLKRVNNEEN